MLDVGLQQHGKIFIVINEGLGSVVLKVPLHQEMEGYAFDKHRNNPSLQ